MYAIYAFVWQIYVPKGTYHVDLLSKHCPGPRIRQFPGIASWVASFQIVTWRVWPKDLSNVCQIVIIAVMLCPITKKKLVQVSKKNNSLAVGGLVPALPQITAQRSRWNLPTEPKTGTLCSGGMYFQEETIKSQNWIESELIEVATIPTQHQLLLGAWQLPSYECRSRLGDDTVSTAQTAKQVSPSNSLAVSLEF